MGKPKAALYNPFITTLGGGEKLSLSIAQVWQQDVSVDVLVDERLLPKGGVAEFSRNLHERLNFPTDIFTIVPYRQRILDRWLAKFGFYPWWLRAYDLVLYVNNEMPFVPFSKTNFAYVQFPFDGPAPRFGDWQAWRRLLRYKSLSRFRHIIVNSHYVASWVDKFWKVNAVVVQSPTDVDAFATDKPKQKTILSVGRFFDSAYNKKQLELVQAFKRMVDEGWLQGWTLAMAGGVGIDGQSYFERVRAEAAGYPVIFYANADFATLRSLYQQSQIFWHATGLREDSKKNPGKFEHFGITTVEAMAAGCIPVVIGFGGMLEIVIPNESGLLWTDEEDLVAQMKRLVGDSDLQGKLRRGAERRSREFGFDRFIGIVQGLLNEALS